MAVVGAVPGGATLARLLQGRGIRVQVFERDASAAARPHGGSFDLRAEKRQVRAITPGPRRTYERRFPAGPVGTVKAAGMRLLSGKLDAVTKPASSPRCGRLTSSPRSSRG